MESPYARQGQTACIKTHLNQSSQPWGPAVHATPRPQRVHLRPDCRQGWQCTNRTQLNRLRYTLIYLSLIPTRLILWRRRFLPTRWPIRSPVANSSLLFSVRTLGTATSYRICSGYHLLCRKKDFKLHSKNNPYHHHDSISHSTYRLHP